MKQVLIRFLQCAVFIALIGGCNLQKDIELRSIGNPGAVDGAFSPSVVSISPTSYGVKGGITVTITGTNFAEGSTVNIGGTNCPNVVIVTDTELTCTLPYHYASVVDVVVASANGTTGTLFDGFSYNSYLYASNQSGASLLTRMRIDSATGAITALGSTAAPSGAYGVEIDPTNTWVYTAGVSVDQIAGYTINHATGDLTPVPGSPFAAGNGVDGLAISKNSKCIVASNYYANNVTSYSINQTNGSLVKVADYAAGTAPGFSAIDPQNRFVYVSNYGSNSISAYRLNSTTCALTVIGTYASGASPDAVSIHPSGKFVYTGNASGTGGVTALSIDQVTGALTLIATYVTANATNGSGVEIEKTGTQIYVTARGGDAVGAGKLFGYDINQTDGTLTTIGNWVTGDGPNDVRILGSGEYVFTANFSGDNVSVFRRNLTTGILTPASPASYSAGDGPAIIGITF